jgi:16S rRNA (uracil1498-N3)-methyltransferase
LTAAHVLVADLSVPTLAPDDAHHLASALRLRPGEEVGATDGRGGYVPCAYSGPGQLEPTGPVVVAPARSPRLMVGFVPVKGDRPEWVVQKLTELGVDEIVLLSSARSVVRWEGAKAASHIERLARVARSALMQSRGVWLPDLSGVAPYSSISGSAVAQMGGGPVGPEVHSILVGPEGGWDAVELSTAGTVVGLGDGVLRAETAAVAAGVLMTALRAGTVAA